MKKQKQAVDVLINKLTKSIGLPFKEVLPSEIIEQVIVDLGIKSRNRLYNPIVIVWSFRISCIRSRP